MEKRYYLTYRVHSAYGNWGPVTIYICKDKEDFERCVRLHVRGDVKILTVDGKPYKGE